MHFWPFMFFGQRRKTLWCKKLGTFSRLLAYLVFLQLGFPLSGLFCLLIWFQSILHLKIQFEFPLTTTFKPLRKCWSPLGSFQKLYLSGFYTTVPWILVKWIQTLSTLTCSIFDTFWGTGSHSTSLESS